MKKKSISIVFTCFLVTFLVLQVWAGNNAVSLFSVLPWWLIYMLTVLLVLSATWVGYQFSLARKKRFGHEPEGPVNTVVGALMGLLAFILAFTFGVTTNKFDSRKELLLNEVTAIETLHLRAGLLPEPHKSEVRKLVKEYVHLRVELIHHPDKLDDIIAGSENIHRELWKHAEALPDTKLLHSDVVSLYTEALNTVIEYQTKRVTVGTIYKLPQALWMSLYLITIFSMMGVGYLFGIAEKANWTLLCFLSLAFSVVIILIADLDNSNSGHDGIISISQEPMLRLERRL